MSEMPTNRELLRSALTREISSSATAFCNSIDNHSEYGGNGPKLAQQIRNGIAMLINQINKDLESLTDDMTPGALLKAMCPRILHTIETKLLDINSLPNDIKRTIRRYEKNIREAIFRECRISVWTDNESSISTVVNKRERPKRDNRKIKPPLKQTSNTKDDGVPFHDSYSRNSSPVRRVAIFNNAEKSRHR